MHLKSHRSHDIVLLCLDWCCHPSPLDHPATPPVNMRCMTLYCRPALLLMQASTHQPALRLSCSHEIAHTSAESLKRDICEEYGVPLMPDTMPPGAHRNGVRRRLVFLMITSCAAEPGLLACRRRHRGWQRPAGAGHRAPSGHRPAAPPPPHAAVPPRVRTCPSPIDGEPIQPPASRQAASLLHCKPVMRFMGHQRFATGLACYCRMLEDTLRAHLGKADEADVSVADIQVNRHHRAPQQQPGNRAQP